jgi:transposase
VEIYGRVRRAVRVEGKSQRAVAREFGLSRETVRKMLLYAVPPGYQRQQPIKRPKLGPWLVVIDAILEHDKQRPAKQRHTAKRIFDRLKEEHQFTGGYTIVKDYVRGEQVRSREVFVPLTHAAGEAQADFGEALVVVAGVERKAHYLAMDPPHSDDCFVVAFPAETTEAFLEGHVRAFAYFGGVPTRVLYDNTKIAVARILGGEQRQRTRAFSELQSYYLFADKFGRPARGNDKGKVEGIVGYARRNFMVPIPRASSWDELNAYLEVNCRKRRERVLRGHKETIGERFERDHTAMLPLPAAPYEACEKLSTRVSSLSLVRYRANDYSVPTQYGHRQVWVQGYVHEVVITCASEVIARHERSYEREAVVFDPLHYLALIEQKTRALDQAAPLAGWQLPECFAPLRRLLEARLKKHGSREYVQVLRLMESFDLLEVTHAVEHALQLGAISFDAVRHLLLCHIEHRPPRLDMANYPHLPLAQVRTTQALDYMSLLVEVAVEACA